ncbi:hypothetical protein PG993_011147 [Apiospora rasikravindrae]|uniref:CENP-V/GFA domain-containing protein n=1 Tax=Apiospora rasikravindrae TaxID=990691 RepID=A0ABR1SDE8_9PEZI
MSLALAPSLEGLRAYEATPHFTRYFCATCGCHMFWRHENAEVGPGKVTFAVATGVLLEKADEGVAGDDDSGKNDRAAAPEQQYGRHINVAGTKDGGLSIWMPELRGRAMEVYGHGGGGTAQEAQTMPVGASGSDADVLQGFCHCGTVSIRITRPDASSRLPRSNYPDLIVPYHTGSPCITNPDDEKWWLRPSRDSSATTRYLAGTCACRSCRLTSGFEIQTWAFIPRSNIYLRVGGAIPDLGSIEDAYQPLDFAAPEGNKSVLQSYESSPGVLREFCARCGANVFWHDKWRPDLIDVSVGLLDAPEGVRAEDWLDWWTERVSFSEDAVDGRYGEVGKRALGLIMSLEYDMKRGIRIHV